MNDLEHGDVESAIDVVLLVGTTAAIIVGCVLVVCTVVAGVVAMWRRR